MRSLLARMHRFGRVVLVGVVAGVHFGLPGPAAAQEYPNRSISLVVPYPPGGSADALARTLGEQLKLSLGQSVVIANRPGAGSLIGTQAVARAANDGYTLLLTGSALTIQAAVNKKFQVDLEREFTPVAEAVRGTFLIATPAAQPFKTLPEMLRHAKARPDDLKFGTNGAGTSSFMTFEYLKSLTDAPLLHIPYKGSAEVVTAVLAGDIQLIADPVFTLLKHVEAGTLRALAVTGARRSPLLPQVPTVAESGVGEFDINYWIGVLAPAGTPRPVVERLSKAIAAAMADAETGKRLAAMGFEPTGTTPDEFARRLQAEYATWRKLAQERGLQLD